MQKETKPKKHFGYKQVELTQEEYVERCQSRLKWKYEEIDKIMENAVFRVLNLMNEAADQGKELVELGQPTPEYVSIGMIFNRNHEKAYERHTAKLNKKRKR